MEKASQADSMPPAEAAPLATNSGAQYANDGCGIGVSRRPLRVRMDG